MLIRLVQTPIGVVFTTGYFQVRFAQYFWGSHTIILFQELYVHTVFEKYARKIEVDGKLYDVAIWDTAGPEDYDRFRPMSYPGTDVVLLCFSIGCPESLSNVEEKVCSGCFFGPSRLANQLCLKWISEIWRFLPKCPVILIGCKKDLRDTQSEPCVSPAEVRIP